MKQCNGFSLSEVLIAMGIIMMLVATALPIYQMIETEEHRIKQHQLIKLALHDELQKAIWEGMVSTPYDLMVASRDITISLSREGDYLKGCAEWENVRETKETICLYGIKEQ